MAATPSRVAVMVWSAPARLTFGGGPLAIASCILTITISSCRLEICCASRPPLNHLRILRHV